MLQNPRGILDIVDGGKKYLEQRVQFYPIVFNLCYPRTSGF